MRLRAGVSLLAALVVTACGSSSQPSAGPAPPPPTLSPRAVPYLPSRLHVMTDRALAREAGAPALRRELRAWGFEAGADRYFQGESRQLQVVDSRALRFRSPAGAAAFVAYVQRHASVYLGAYPGLRGFTSRGRQGILVTGQPCTCHLANPAFLAVVKRGGVVTWLEINGPGATRRRLATLMAAAP